MTDVEDIADGHVRRSAPAGSQEAAGRAVWAFVLVVSVIGAVVISLALAALRRAPVNAYLFLLAILTVTSGRFTIKVPGRPATVLVSEVFVFASVLLFGPAPATLTLALDGLWISLAKQNRRLYRTLFNVAEPAISIWVAGTVFFALAGVAPLAQPHAGITTFVLPAVAMTATYFLLNSVLQAVAAALESGGSALKLWRKDALYLAINFYAAASIATLAVENAGGLNLQVIGLVVPLLILSYVAYQAASSRMEDAEQHIRDVEHLYHATVQTLAIAVDAKDQATHGHIRRVQRHTIALARTLGIHDEVEIKALEAASLLHDVGKLAVPDYVLNKPGALSRAEFERIKVHAGKGAEILTAVNFPYPVVPIVRHHHEQWNGRGYPDGLSGEAIPLGARILTVVDCFDAVTSDRPYRRKLSDTEAISILRARSGIMYDPRIVDTFIQLVPHLRREDDREAANAVVTFSLSAADRIPAPGASYSDFDASGSMSPWTLLGLIGPALTEKLARLLPAAEACLFSLEPGADVLLAAHATPLVRDAVAHLRLQVGEGLSGWVAAHRHTIVNSDPGLDLGDAGVRLGLRACTSTPVFAFGNLVGVESVYLPEPRGFSDSHVRVVGALAQEIGLEFARYEQACDIEGHGTDAVRRGVPPER